MPDTRSRSSGPPPTRSRITWGAPLVTVNVPRSWRTSAVARLSVGLKGVKSVTS
jgi:hypothetical protein